MAAAGRAARRRRRAVPRRGAGRATARAGPRAAPGGLRWRRLTAVIDGSAGADIDALEGRLAAVLAAVADATGRGRPDHGGGRDPRAGRRRVPAAEAGGEPQSREDGRPCCSTWCCRAWVPWRPAPTWPPQARPGSMSCALRRSLPTACDGRLDHGRPRTWPDVRALLALPRPSGLRGRGRGAIPGCSTVAGERAHPRGDGRQRLGGRGVAGPRPVRGDPRVGARLDAIETGVPPDPALTEPACWRPRRPPVSSACLRAGFSEPPAAARTRSTSRRATRPRAGP